MITYLVPTEVAVEAARSTHRQWLATRPDTNGKNRTWNLWFGDSGPAKANGFAAKWAKYRLEAAVAVSAASAPEASLSHTASLLKNAIAAAKQSIAEAAGVPLEAVRISIDLA